MQIGPRVIRQPTPTPTPAPTPQATAPAPGPTPTPTPTQTRSTPTPTATRAPQRTPAPTPTARSSPAPSASPPGPSQSAAAEPQNAGAQGADVPLGSDVGPGFDTLPDGIGETDPIGPDDWYDVDSGASDAEGAGYAEIGQSGALESWDTTQNRIIAGIALLLLLLGAVAGLIWRRRRTETVAQSTPNPGLASGIRNTITNQMPSVLQDTPNWAKDKPQSKSPSPASKPEPETALEPDLADVLEPEPAEEPAAALTSDTPAEAARLDLDLEVTSATRSFMMFTIEFRIDVANRSDHAVRDLSISGNLTCAQRGPGNGVPIAGGQPIAGIDRIGPQQSRVVTGTLQLPLSEVTPIKQGSKPLLIPLLHLTLEGNGQRAMNRTFVLGTPSAAASGRVHPLPLDGPPGGLPPLRAQVIKQPDVSDTEPA